MELVSAARRAMLADPTIAGYVQSRVFKYRLEEVVDGTGRAAVVLKQSGGWSQPDPRSPMRYPLLMVRCYADPTRDALTRTMLRADAEDRALALHRAVDRFIFANGDGAGRTWGAGPDGTGGLAVIDASLWSEPILITNDDGHDDSGPVSLGDSVYWQTEYAMTVTY